MRYRDLAEARTWRHYTGSDRACTLASLADPSAAPVEARVQFGSVTTGRQRVWVGYFVQVIGEDGGEWLAENPYSLRRALRAAEAKLNEDRLSLKVIGLDREWQETGLSANSGWGYHPDFDEAVHMLLTRY